MWESTEFPGTSWDRGTCHKSLQVWGRATTGARAEPGLKPGLPPPITGSSQSTETVLLGLARNRRKTRPAGWGPRRACFHLGSLSPTTEGKGPGTAPVGPSPSSAAPALPWTLPQLFTPAVLTKTRHPPGSCLSTRGNKPSLDITNLLSGRDFLKETPKTPSTYAPIKIRFQGYHSVIKI